MSEEKVYIDSDNLIKVTDLKDAETDVYINDATIKMSLFEGDELDLDCCELTFTGGGTDEPVAGDVLKGATGGATATIKSVTLVSGTWAGGDAAGRIEILNQLGTFEAEDLNIVDGQANVATIAAESTGAETANAGTKTKLLIRNHGLTTDDYVYIQGTKNYDGYYTPSAVELDKITIDTAFVAEKFSGYETVFVGIEGATDISLTHEGGDDDGYYDGILPDEMIGLVNDNYYWRIIKITKATGVLTVKQRCRAAYFLELN